jgi:hypothetical protein
VVPGETARRLQKLALALLPIMGLVYVVTLLWGDLQLGFGTGHGYLALAFIGGPSILFYLISRLFPRVRRVICQRCSWNQEYPDFGASHPGRSSE